MIFLGAILATVIYLTVTGVDRTESERTPVTHP